VSARPARLALRLYPLAYRRRYGAEMEALVEDSGASPGAVADLVQGAIGAHLRPEPGVAAAVGRDERLRHGLAAVLACWAVFVVAGLALYKTVEGVPFEGVPAVPAALNALHLGIQVLALVGGAAIALGAAPFAAAALVEGGKRPVAWRRLFAGEPWRSSYGLATACAAVAAAAMVAIAALTAAYLAVLAIDAPGLASEPNGPFGTPDVAVSLALQLALMLAAAAPAALAATRARRTLARAG
jgi:hypothetical protein